MSLAQAGCSEGETKGGKEATPQGPDGSVRRTGSEWGSKHNGGVGTLHKNRFMAGQGSERNSGSTTIRHQPGFS